MRPTHLLLVLLVCGLVPATGAAADYLWIGGSPATTIVAGRGYWFKPWVLAPTATRSKVVFSVANKPYWANFNTSTGQFSGAVRTAQIGVYRNILISATDGRISRHMPAFTVTVTGSGSTSGSGNANSPPHISGTAAASALVGSAYSFQPTASDPNGDKLTFSVFRNPSWAKLDTTTGRLYGTPTAADVGSFANIVITASDGKASTSLTAFTIVVSPAAAATGSLTLSWDSPTTNVDGSALTDLAGYVINYGTSASALNKSVQLANANATSQVIANLAPSTYYFDIVAYTHAGLRSAVSNVASATLK
jgi:hypothetical protein